VLCYTHERRNGWEPVTGLRFSRVLGVASVVALLQISFALADGKTDEKPAAEPQVSIVPRP